MQRATTTNGEMFPRQSDARTARIAKAHPHEGVRLLHVINNRTKEREIFFSRSVQRTAAKFYFAPSGGRSTSLPTCYEPRLDVNTNRMYDSPISQTKGEKQ